MKWFGRSEQPKPDDGAKRAETMRLLLKQAQTTLFALLPEAKQAGELADLAEADDETKRAYVKRLIDIYEITDGTPFIAYRRGKDEAEEVSSARDAVQKALELLNLIGDFPLQQRKEVTKEEWAELGRKQREASMSPYEKSLEQLHSFLTQRLDPTRPIIDQVNLLIDKVNLANIDATIVSKLRGDEKEKRARLKDALIPLLVRDGYFNKS